MRFFLDTEFIEDGVTIDLLSIGIVAEDGREFYAEVEPEDVPWATASQWVNDNVVPHLYRDASLVHDAGQIAADIRGFIGPDKPEFWGYYADYDWVVVCQLFGTMMDLPKGWPKFCMDIKQLAVSMGNPRLPEEGDDVHHALADARWNRQAWEFLEARR